MAHLAANSFNAGELSPLLLGRPDLGKYRNGCLVLENFLCRKYGGITRRPGTEYVATLRDSAETGRLLPFVYNSGQAYVLCFNDGYLRFFKDGAALGAPLEYASPYAAADLRAIRHAQSADVMFLTHPSYQQRTLTRTSDSAWALAAKSYDDGPFLDENETAVTITPTAVNAAAGSNVILTASAATFDADHVGALWRVKYRPIKKSASNTVNGTTDSEKHIIRVDHDYALSLGNVWSLSVYLQRSEDHGVTWRNLRAFSDNISITGTETNPGALYRLSFNVGGNLSYAINSMDDWHYGIVRISDVASSTVAMAEILQDLPQADPIGTPSAWAGTTAYAHGDMVVESSHMYYCLEAHTSGTFADDLAAGKWVLFDAAATTAWANSTEYVYGDVVTDGGNDYFCLIAHTSPAPAGTMAADITAAKWVLIANHAVTEWAEGAWSDYRGWPRCVTIFEDRLIYAGTTHQPDTVWMSRTGDWDSFATGSDDDSAITATLASERVNQIRWLAAKDYLMVGTTGGEWKLAATGSSEPITPTNLEARRVGTYGSADIQPVTTNQVILFWQTQARRLRELVYSFEMDSFVAPDLNLLSEHITYGGVVEHAFASFPDPVLWAVRADGTLLGMTYEREQEVVGWHRNILGQNCLPIVESVCVIPGTDRDEVWLIVNRTNGSALVRTVERMRGIEWADLDDAAYLDAGVYWDGGDSGTVDQVAIDVAGEVTCTMAALPQDSDGTDMIDGDLLDIFTHPALTFLEDDGPFQISDLAGSGPYTFKLKTADGAGYYTVPAGEEDQTITADGYGRLVKHTMTGLDHIEGLEAGLVADGVEYAADTVSSGSVSLPADTYGHTIYAGLAIAANLIPMPFEVEMGDGTSMGRPKRIHAMTARLYDAAIPSVGDAQITTTPVTRDGRPTLLEHTVYKDQADWDGQTYTRDERLPVDDGFETQETTLIRASNAGPCSILALIAEMEVGRV